MWSTLLELLVPSVCPACDVARRPGEPLLCATCARGIAPLSRLRGVRTALAYRGTALTLVRRFKFDDRRDALAVLLEPLVARLERLRVDAVVPLPRHPERVRELGTDPVHELARRLSRRLEVPLCAQVLSRTRHVPPQTGLSLVARRGNVQDSFAARAESLRGRTLLLLDDVTTSGATLAAASHVLSRDAGARRVIPAALAGTPLGDV